MVDRKLNYITQPQLKNISTIISKHPSLKNPYTRVYGKRWADTKNITKLMHNITIKTNIPCTTKYIVDPQKITNTLMRPPLESPHTRVCGMRMVFKKTYSNPKTKPKSTNTLKTNTFKSLKIKNVALADTKTIKHTQHPNVYTNKTIHKPVHTTHKHIIPTNILTSNSLRTKTKAYSKTHTITYKLRRLLNPHTYKTKNKHTNTIQKQKKNQPNILYAILLSHKNPNKHTIYQYKLNIHKPKPYIKSHKHINTKLKTYNTTYSPSQKPHISRKKEAKNTTHNTTQNKLSIKQPHISANKQIQNAYRSPKQKLIVLNKLTHSHTPNITKTLTSTFKDSYKSERTGQYKHNKTILKLIKSICPHTYIINERDTPNLKHNKCLHPCSKPHINTHNQLSQKTLTYICKKRKLRTTTSKHINTNSKPYITINKPIYQLFQKTLTYICKMRKYTHTDHQSTKNK